MVNVNHSRLRALSGGSRLGRLGWSKFAKEAPGVFALSERGCTFRDGCHEQVSFGFQRAIKDDRFNPRGAEGNDFNPHFDTQVKVFFPPLSLSLSLFLSPRGNKHLHSCAQRVNKD